MNLSLHSNMFLLILKAQMMWCEIEHLFTFQYVSINTQPTRQNRLANYTLHSNMFLLIQVEAHLESGKIIPLHSNMFLLIHHSFQIKLYALIFTFQYVSINTKNCFSRKQGRSPLHSNMFLLIRYKTSIVTGEMRSFTFQYVSINTNKYWYSLTLNKLLYIPICFY